MVRLETRFRRLLFSAIAALCIGAIANIGLAWFAAAWVDPTMVTPVITNQPLDRNTWRTTGVQETFAHTRINVIVGDSTSINGVPREIRTPELPEKKIEPLAFSEDRVGWPLPALKSINNKGASILVMGVGGMMHGNPDGGSLVGGVELDNFKSRLGQWRALPYLPIWSGLIANTLLFGAILWFLIIGFTSIRRRLRVKLRRCTACGYDLRGASHGRCPECGEVVETDHSVISSTNSSEIGRDSPESVSPD